MFVAIGARGNNGDIDGDAFCCAFRHNANPMPHFFKVCDHPVDGVMGLNIFFLHFFESGDHSSNANFVVQVTALHIPTAQLAKTGFKPHCVADVNAQS